MLIFKVLKRKDASSVVVAVVLGLLLLTLLSAWSMELTNKITDATGIYGNSGFGNGWKNLYLNPGVSALVQVLILEALLWVWVVVKLVSSSAMKQNKSSKSKSKK